MRLFIAIDLPEEIKEGIFKKFEKFKDSDLFRGNVVEKENLHLTLKFLGEIEEEKVEEIKQRLKEIKFEKFNVKVGKVGFFDNEKYIRIIWVELISDEILKLQKQVADKFPEIRFGFKGFHSHVTVIRVKSVKDKSNLIKEIKKIRLEEMGFNVNEFVLMNSEKVNEKRVYKIIEKYK